ncbi:MAG: nicotinate-nucleotide adenylyltransferase [Chloroflexi bacterium]|nr:nicotinate-nucleotide adenylyltransferase [Chloroflexota bacterium]
MEDARLGVLGGTFDPIHYGHLQLAEQALFQFNLDRVLFIPAGAPPHKVHSPVTDARDRYVMTVLATVSNPRLEVSTIELDRTGRSYTVDTLRELHSSYGPGVELYFILGADAVRGRELHREAKAVQTLRFLKPEVATHPAGVWYD